MTDANAVAPPISEIPSLMTCRLRSISVYFSLSPVVYAGLKCLSIRTTPPPFASLPSVRVCKITARTNFVLYTVGRCSSKRICECILVILKFGFVCPPKNYTLHDLYLFSQTPYSV